MAEIRFVRNIRFEYSFAEYSNNIDYVRATKLATTKCCSRSAKNPTNLFTRFKDMGSQMYVVVFPQEIWRINAIF